MIPIPSVTQMAIPKHFSSQSTYIYTGVLKISLAGANNLVPTISLTPCIIIIHVYTCNYSGAGKNIDAR